MSVHDNARKLEAYLSKLMYTLNYQASEDPAFMLPIGQIRMLRALQSGPKTITDLADLLNISPSAASQLVTRMVAGKYVERLEDPKDRRIRMIQLAERGTQLVEQRLQKRTGHAQQMLDGLGEQRSQELLAILTELAPICSKITAKSGILAEDLASTSSEELSS